MVSRNIQTLTAVGLLYEIRYSYSLLCQVQTPSINLHYMLLYLTLGWQWQRLCNDRRLHWSVVVAFNVRPKHQKVSWKNLYTEICLCCLRHYLICIHFFPAWRLFNSKIHQILNSTTGRYFPFQWYAHIFFITNKTTSSKYIASVMAIVTFWELIKHFNGEFLKMADFLISGCCSNGSSKA